MPALSTLLLFTAASLALLAIPGPAVIYVVTYAGAAYLVVLGLRKLLERELIREPSPEHRPRLFINGLTVQLLNPKIAIFFVAFLPQFVTRARGSGPLQSLLLGVVFTALAIISDGSYALVAGAAGRWLRRSAGATRWLTKLSGGIYVGLGIAAAFSGGSHATRH